MSLNTEINKIIENHISGYINKISNKFSISVEDLNSMWAEHHEYKEKPKKNEEKVFESSSSSSQEGEFCPYTFTKGAKEGQSCTSRPNNGAVYCSRHKKYEGTIPKTKKVLPVPKKSIGNGVKSKKPLLIPEQSNTILRKNNKIDKLWHPETSLVFKSSEERIVIGKYDDGEILALTESDIEVCVEYGFGYEKKSEKVDIETTINSCLGITKKEELVHLAESSIEIQQSVDEIINGDNVTKEDVEDILGEIQKNLSSDDEEYEEDLLEEEEE